MWCAFEVFSFHGGHRGSASATLIRPSKMVAFGEFPFSTIWIHVSRVDFLFFFFVLWQPRCRWELFRNLSKKNPLDGPCCKQDILTLGKRSPAVFSRRYRWPVYQFSKVSCTSASNQRSLNYFEFWMIRQCKCTVILSDLPHKKNTAVFALVASICIQIYVYNIYIYTLCMYIYTHIIYIYTYIDNITICSVSDNDICSGSYYPF